MGEIEARLSSIQASSPMRQEVVIGSVESGEACWWDDVISTQKAETGNLQMLREQYGLALERIELGTYGTCEGCGGQIEDERLEALPTANTCLSCVS